MKTISHRAFIGIFALACAALPLSSLRAAPAPSTGRTGLNLIGLLSLKDSQIPITAEVLSSVPAGKDVGIHYLAFSFVPGAVANKRSKEDFTKVTSLITAVMPKLPAGSNFVVQTSLDDGPNRYLKPAWTTFHPKLDLKNFWSKIEASDTTFKEDWKANVATPFKEWSDSILKWAKDNGYGTRLRLDVCPVLEDRATSNVAYERLVVWTKQVGLNSSIVFVRNPVDSGIPEDGKVSGVSRIEWHTTDVEFLKKRLKATYVVSNDGETANGTTWGNVQRTALERQASAYLWRAAFNGDRNNTPPYERGALEPFNADTRASAIVWINERFGM